MARTLVEQGTAEGRAIHSLPQVSRRTRASMSGGLTRTSTSPVLDSSKLVVEELGGDDDRVIALLRIPLRSGAGEALISEHWRMRDGKATHLQAFWFDTRPAAAAA